MHIRYHTILGEKQTTSNSSRKRNRPVCLTHRTHQSRVPDRHDEVEEGFETRFLPRRAILHLQHTDTHDKLVGRVRTEIFDRLLLLAASPWVRGNLPCRRRVSRRCASRPWLFPAPVFFHPYQAPNFQVYLSRPDINIAGLTCRASNCKSSTGNRYASLVKCKITWHRWPLGSPYAPRAAAACGWLEFVCSRNAVVLIEL